MRNKEKIKDLEEKLEHISKENFDLKYKLQLLTKLNGQEYIIENYNDCWLDLGCKITYIYENDIKFFNIKHFDKDLIDVVYSDPEYFIIKIKNDKSIINFISKKDPTNININITDYVIKILEEGQHSKTIRIK